MKARVLYFPENNKKLQLLSQVVCGKLSCKSDKIPPAYPCENEKLVIIGIQVGKEVPDVLRRFCRELVKTRAQNVAFFVDGPKTTATEVMNAAREAGTNVIGATFECKTGGLPLFVKVSDEEKKGLEGWIDKISAELK